MNACSCSIPTRSPETYRPRPSSCMPSWNVIRPRSWPAGPGTSRKLAYPVKGHKKGLYYLTYFRSEGKHLVNLGAAISPLNEMVLRQLILNIDPKLVEIMLALARDEHALALHTVNEQIDGRRGTHGERSPRSARPAWPKGRRQGLAIRIALGRACGTVADRCILWPTFDFHPGVVSAASFCSQETAPWQT